MSAFLYDPWFYAVAVPAVMLVGFSKGGFAGAGLMSVPLMALVMPPVQAAAIMLPILLIMDAASIWSWRRYNDRNLLISLLPGAFVGVAIGWMTASVVTDDMVRLIVGIVALLSVLRFLQARLQKTEKAAERSIPAASFWGTLSGFTSFVSHAGGPPFQMYALPLRLDPKTYTGASVRFFAIVNVFKVFPYFYLGQFDGTNRSASAALVPAALLATFVSARLIRHMRPEVFYPLIYALILAVSLKLIWDGVVDAVI